MMIHVSSPWFEYIKTGEKTVEGRLCKSKFNTLQPGTSLSIYLQSHDKQDVVSVDVKRVTRYPSFAALLEKEGIKRVLPYYPNVHTGVEAYREFYSREDEEKYGVMAIEFTVSQNAHFFT